MTQAHDVGLTRVGFHVVVDVFLSRVVVWTAPEILVPLPLVYPDIVDQHFRGKCHSGEVDILPPRRNTQVEDQCLDDTVSRCDRVGYHRNLP